LDHEAPFSTESAFSDPPEVQKEQDVPPTHLEGNQKNDPLEADSDTNTNSPLQDGSPLPTSPESILPTDPEPQPEPQEEQVDSSPEAESAQNEENNDHPVEPPEDIIEENIDEEDLSCEENHDHQIENPEDAIEESEQNTENGEEALVEESPLPKEETSCLPTEIEEEDLLMSLSDESEPIFIAFVMYEPDEFVTYLQAGTPFSSLALGTVAGGFTRGRDLYWLPIIWDYEEFDSSIPGRYTLTGHVVLPEGFFSSENKPFSVEQVVIVYEEGREGFVNIQTCHYNSTGAVVIPLGTPKEDLPLYFEDVSTTAVLITVYGDYITCPISIDYNKIDPSKEGAYYPLSIDLPPGITLEENKALCSAVHVIQREEVVLDAISTHDSGYFIQWFAPTTNPVLWAAINGGPWVKPHLLYYGRFNPYGDSQRTSSLLLYYSILQQDHLYQFKVQHGDNLFSNILTLDFTNGKSPHISTDKEGDRTGVDREETPSLPETSQNPDSFLGLNPNYALAEEESSPPTQPSIFLSGKQLQVMTLANPQILTFQQENLFMYIPTEEILALSLNDESRVSIFLEELKENTFYFSFLVDDQPIDLPFYLYLPFAFEDSLLIFEDGTVIENIPSPLFEEEHRFLCSSPGIYTLQNHP
ncbi:MAG: hypothetical protein GX786_02790, partial [Clostridiales bacterium]|nr:hypothetical protein [Clostridiales bacterium]